MRRALAAGATGVAALAALAVAPVPLAAGVILVPGEERTVASAMLRAAPGDTIVVEPGRYFGPIELKSNVRLVGLRGPSQTFLYLDAPGATLRSLGGGPATALVGFTLQGTGTGVEVGRGALQIYDCRFEPHLRTGLRCAAGGHVRLFASVFENLPLAVDAQPGADLLMMRNTLSQEETSAANCEEQPRFRS